MWLQFCGLPGLPGLRSASRGLRLGGDATLCECRHFSSSGNKKQRKTGLKKVASEVVKQPLEAVNG